MLTYTSVKDKYSNIGLDYCRSVTGCCGVSILKGFNKIKTKEQLIYSLKDIKVTEDAHTVYNTSRLSAGYNDDPEKIYPYEGGFRGSQVMAFLTDQQQKSVDMLLELGFTIINEDINKNSGNVLYTLSINPDKLNEVLERC